MRNRILDVLRFGTPMGANQESRKAGNQEKTMGIAILNRE
jgi:hypothetical protein